METWQQRRSESHSDIDIVAGTLFATGALIAILTVATASVLIAGRMAAQVRQVGTLKAVGVTPRQVMLVLLVEHLAIAAVATAVGRAGAGDVVERLAAGLETQLGPTWPDGVEVSFGQWQKLALARGFMRDRPLLLVLDEPTAALDAETEHALFERYAAAARGDGRITILVSHRFSTVRMADLIVVLDGARVLEVGSHGELMARGGRYAELYGIQAAAYR
jgi:ABC-type transport system involved in cytochrome bd biosynthesis fused ATPase/permease subunit